MSLATQSTTYLDASFRARVLIAIATAAAAIVGEVQPPATPFRNAKRHALAAACAANPNAYLDAFCIAAVCDGTVAAAGVNVLDGPLQNAVNAAVNNIAGVANGE